MSDYDMIRRGDALAACGGDDLIEKHAWHCKQRIATIPAAQVAVKPLVWLGEVGGHRWYAGEYEIAYDGWSYVATWLNCKVVTSCPTLDAAKSAAQADYDARIRAALEVGPAPDVARLVEALRECLAFLENECAGWPTAEPERRIARAALAAFEEKANE